ncbi:replication family protein [Salmonella enterica subsp. enterica serovar Typhimurium]|nr:replication family protein [Salmonella enterica subsp. enterica serovar Typhimurium]
MAEGLEYAAKPADRVTDPECCLELTRKTRKGRFVAVGGALKDVQKLDQETDAGMVFGDDISGGEEGGSRIGFEWKTEVRKCRRSPAKEKTETGKGGVGEPP